MLACLPVARTAPGVVSSTADRETAARKREEVQLELEKTVSKLSIARSALVDEEVAAKCGKPMVGAQC